MFRIITASAAALAGASLIASAEMHPGEFFARDRAGNWRSAIQDPAQTFGSIPRGISNRNDTALIIAEARRQGVPVRLALKVCKVESGCRLNATGPMTRHGRHFGAYQIRPSSAARFGYRGGSLQGEQGLRFGMAHLKDCYTRAGGNEALAARCHVGGPGALGKRLNARAEAYAQRYTRQVVNAAPPAWAGTLIAMNF